MHGTVPPPGSFVWIRRQRWRVERVRRDRDVIRFDVTGRHARMTFLWPFDRPLVIARDHTPRHVRRQSALARFAGILARASGFRDLGSATDARIDVMPFQLEPAMAMQSASTRILIADAVGLGKTIQAGLVIAERQRVDPASRTLIVVPSSLRAQWARELREHFRIDTQIGDAMVLAHIAAASARHDAIWDRAGVWLASIDYLKQPQVIAGVCRSPWDLVVIDEAHVVCGDSQRHDAADTIARRARRLVLLTATPHNGDPAAFNRLLSLGGLPGEAPVAIFRRTRESLRLPAHRRVRRYRVPLAVEERRLLNLLTEFECAVTSQTAGDTAEGALLLVSVFRKRALSTAAAFNLSIERRLTWLAGSSAQEPGWRQAALNFERSEDDITPDEGRALAASTGLAPGAERSWLRRLREAGMLAATRDSKVRRVLRLIARTREPVVIFTEFRDSLMRILRDVPSTRACSVIHGGQPPTVQQAEVDRFVTGLSSVLLATDVAGQGLNLHHRCRWVINLELPWNPVRLEQRAGRVDRLGQKRTVHVGLLVADHDSEHSVAAHLTRRTLRAEASVGTGSLGVASSLVYSANDHATVSLPADSRWSRGARALARGLQRRRVLAARWRTEAASSRPAAMRARGCVPMRCFLVPLVDRLGTVIEHRLVCVAHNADAPVERCVAMAIARAWPRAQRLTRLRLREHARMAARERAMHRAWREIHAPGEIQAGLFDRRALRTRDSAESEVHELDVALENALARLDAAVTIEVGAPVLVFIVYPPNLP